MTGQLRKMLAYVDESGTPSASGRSTAHFTMAAVMLREERLPEALSWLDDIKIRTNRKVEHELHWNKLKKVSHRALVAAELGTQEWGRFTSVVVCKHGLRANQLNDDQAYLYTLRYLCERISWFARRHQLETQLTVAHRVRFKREKLVEYDARLRALAGCQIAWSHLSLRDALLDQPKRCAPLQIADVLTSSLAAGFEPDANGVVHPSYALSYRGRVDRGTTNKPLVYGVKVHPGQATSSHQWLSRL